MKILISPFFILRMIHSVLNSFWQTKLLLFDIHLRKMLRTLLTVCGNGTKQGYPRIYIFMAHVVFQVATYYKNRGGFVQGNSPRSLKGASTFNHPLSKSYSEMPTRILPRTPSNSNATPKLPLTPKCDNASYQHP